MEASYNDLVPGQYVAVRYGASEPGEPIWHERFLLAQISTGDASEDEGPGSWFIATPDGDVYVEQLRGLPETGPVAYHVLARRRLNRWVPRGQIYRFEQTLTLEQARLYTSYMLEQVRDDPSQVLVEHTDGLSADFQTVEYKNYFLVSDALVAAAPGGAAPVGDTGRRRLRGKFIWVNSEPFRDATGKVVLPGSEILPGAGTVFLKHKALHPLSHEDGVITLERLELGEVAGYSDRRALAFGSPRAASVGPSEPQERRGNRPSSSSQYGRGP